MPERSALRAAAMQQQAVGGDQQDFEKHEQVEQVAGQEGAAKPEQLHLEENVKMPSVAVDPAAGIQQRKQREQRRGQHHPRGQAVGNQHDAPGRRPVSQRIDENVAAAHRKQQERREHDLAERGR